MHRGISGRTCRVDAKFVSIDASTPRINITAAGVARQEDLEEMGRAYEIPAVTIRTTLNAAPVEPKPVRRLMTFIRNCPGSMASGVFTWTKKGTGGFDCRSRDRARKNVACARLMKDRQKISEPSKKSSLTGCLKILESVLLDGSKRTGTK